MALAGNGQVGSVGESTSGEFSDAMKQVQRVFLNKINDKKSDLGKMMDVARSKNGTGFCQEECVLPNKFSAADIQMALKSAEDYSGTWRGSEEDSDPGYIDITAEITVLVRTVSYGGRFSGLTALDFTCNFNQVDEKEAEIKCSKK